ncbi:hypothetical protein PLICRDRAFT_174961 [Plicaturopsis crispa FD-325 SS-3]|nr:hypothetical protein PLICRDRAFT_174961 [Plicaturopsis crispa FD-325 SS-3]
MLNAFKIKPFDLEPVFESWSNPPVFVGNPKKDPSVDAWLESIKAGCVERKVPEEYWHKVAQHYMGEKAKARLDELKVVLAKMNGGKYRWSWKKFNVAMHNMGWDIDSGATETVKVRGSSIGTWWASRKDNKEEPVAVAKDVKDVVRRPSAKEMKSDTAVPTHHKRGRPSRSNTLKDEDFVTVTKPRAPVRSQTLGPGITDTKSSLVAAGPPSQADSQADESVTTVTNAPLWLLNACSALDFLTAEHPKAMSAISAILITAGTIPAIPAISAGAGGAVLASGAAQAVGAIAVSVGSWIKAQHDVQAKALTGAGQEQGQIEAVPANASTK